MLLADAGLVSTSRYPVSIRAAPPPPAPDKDAQIAAHNARLADFIATQKAGAPQLGVFMFSASPVAAAAAIDMGHD